jgi:hypothetical protein
VRREYESLPTEISDVRSKVRICSLFFTAAALAMSGCGSQQTTVTGTVTLDGEPLAIGPAQRGTVVFQPVDGGAVATGLIDQHGKYHISTGAGIGLVPGKYAITVRAVEVVPATKGTVEPTGRPLTPAVYAAANTSGFTFDIAPGANTCHLALRSDAGSTAVPEPVEAGSNSEEDREPSGEESPGGKAGASARVGEPK